MKYAWHKKTFNIVNILVSGIFHGHFAQRLAVNKPCLQIVRRLLWKQTTTHSIRNNNPIFDWEEPLVKQIRPTVYINLHFIRALSSSVWWPQKEEFYLSPSLLHCGQIFEYLVEIGHIWLKIFETSPYSGWHSLIHKVASFGEVLWRDHEDFQLEHDVDDCCTFPC